jgi:L-ascorbate metabolism protein UlaG (beta-lactamase superfamily)
MPSTPLYLRPNVLAEPLFHQWYATAALLPPATAAMYVAYSHVKAMRSFIANPRLHVEALAEPGMLGSSYLSHAPERAPEVAALLESTLREQAPLLELAEALRGLDGLLESEAEGHSLEPLYPRVPAPLRGFVELVYDLAHQPTYRLLEPLLYRSRYYHPGWQSVLLSLAEEDERPFVFSTPRLWGPREQERTLRLRMPFHHEGLDALFRARLEPAPLEQVRESLGLPPEESWRLERLLTPTAPRPPPPPPPAGGVRVRYFGHACLLVETAEVSLLLDPVIPYGHGAGPARFSFEDLPGRVDYAVMTHAHQDHCVLETLLQLRPRLGAVVVPRSSGGSLQDPSLRLALRQCGFRQVLELGELESLPLPGGALTAIPFLGEHADLAIATKSAFLVELHGQRVLAIADSNAFEPEVYAHVHEAVGDVDVLFVGMECEGAPLTWIAGPLMTRKVSRKVDQSRRFSGSSCATALAMVERFHPRQVYVYAMGQEPWLTFLTSIRYTPESRPMVESDRLVAACRERGLRAERLYGCRELLLGRQ